MLDLRKAYLQIRIDPELWVYQAVLWKNDVYLLTRLGFGLASAPKLMTAVVDKALEHNKAIRRPVTTYIDDLCVVEDIVSANEVKRHLSQWGLEAKEPEKLNSTLNVRVLGLNVDSRMRWGRDKRPDIEVSNSLTKRQAH